MGDARPNRITVPTEYEQGKADGIKETEREFMVMMVALCRRYGPRLEVYDVELAGANRHDLHWGVTTLPDPLRQLTYFEVNEIVNEDS